MPKLIVDSMRILRNMLTIIIINNKQTDTKSDFSVKAFKTNIKPFTLKFITVTKNSHTH